MSIFAEYRRSLKLIEVEEVFDLFLYRPFAFGLVKSITKTNITPNQITVLSLLIGVLAGVSYGFGRRPLIVLGALLYGLSIVLDCADGQLARLKNNGTRLGRLLDGLTDYFVSLAIYLGIGIGLASKSEHPAVFWLLLLAAALSQMFHSISLDKFRSRFINYVRGSSVHVEDADYRSFREEGNALKTQKGHHLHKAAIGIYLKYLDAQKKLTFQKQGARPVQKIDKDIFCRKNRSVLRGWTFLGPSTGGTLLIVASLIGRIDFYFWGLIVVGNIWAVIMFVVQKRIDRNPAGETAS